MTTATRYNEHTPPYRPHLDAEPHAELATPTGSLCHICGRLRESVGQNVNGWRTAQHGVTA